jgi:hypothetical protein
LVGLALIRLACGNIRKADDKQLEAGNETSMYFLGLKQVNNGASSCIVLDQPLLHLVVCILY